MRNCSTARIRTLRQPTRRRAAAKGVTALLRPARVACAGTLGLLALLPLRLSALRTRAGLVGPPEYRPAVKPRPTACAPPPARRCWRRLRSWRVPRRLQRCLHSRRWAALLPIPRFSSSHAAACADSSAVPPTACAPWLHGASAFGGLPRVPTPACVSSATPPITATATPPHAPPSATPPITASRHAAAFSDVSDHGDARTPAAARLERSMRMSAPRSLLAKALRPDIGENGLGRERQRK